MTTAPAQSAAQAALAAPEAGRRTGRIHRAESRWGLLLAGPAALHTLLWIGVPVLVAFALSFTSYDIIRQPTFAGLQNYGELLGDGLFWRSMLHNLIIAAIGVPVSMFLALLFAVMLNAGLRGTTVFRTLIFIPHVTATVAVAMVWLWIYAPSDSGLMNSLLSFVGIPPQSYLTDVNLALPAVILVTIWQGIGLKMLIYLAALQGVNQDLYEAADLDGASASQKFRHITIPMLRPATFFILVTSIIGNFQTFDLIYVLTEGGPANATSVVTYRIYQTAFQEFRMGLACAQSMILLLVLVVLTVISRRAIGGSDDD